MKKPRLFVDPQPIRSESLMRVVLGLFLFVVAPLLSAYVITRGEQSALYNSLSRLAYDEGYLVAVFACGIVHGATYAFAQFLALRRLGFARWARILLLCLTVVLVLTILAGLGIPCYFNDDPHDIMLRNLHIQVTTAAFVALYANVLLFTIIVWFCHRRVAFLATMVDAFTCIAGLFALRYVRDTTSFVVTSSVAQVLLFFLYSLCMAMHYYGAMMFLPTSPTGQCQPASLSVAAPPADLTEVNAPDEARDVQASSDTAIAPRD